MGLTIHSLGELPVEAARGYYIYLLDHGWKEPMGETLRANFSQMADLASRHDAVVLRGVVGYHFADEVLSWHHVNGQDSKDLLPAILITTRHPHEFRGFPRDADSGSQPEHRLILIPLNDHCKTATDVTVLIQRIFRDIQDRKELSDFEVVREMNAGQNAAVTDALVLQPNFAGVGVDLKKLLRFFKTGILRRGES